MNFPIAVSGTAISADTFSEQTNRLGKRLWAKCFNFVVITLLSLSLSDETMAIGEACNVALASSYKDDKSELLASVGQLKKVTESAFVILKTALSDEIAVVKHIHGERG